MLPTDKALSVASHYTFTNIPVHTVTDEHGYAWFVAKDVCACLGLSDTGRALERLRSTEKLTRILFVSGQNREVWLVNEPGLYRLIFTSRKPEAEAFQDWVYHTVLPAINRTGSYGAPASITPEIQALIQVEAAQAVQAALANKTQTRREIASRLDGIADVSLFISECCTEHPGKYTKTTDLYREYQKWTATRGRVAVLLRYFGQSLGQLGYWKVRRSSGAFRHGLVIGTGGAA